MSNDLTDILQQLANGEIDQAEAARLIDGVNAPSEPEVENPGEQPGGIKNFLRETFRRDPNSSPDQAKRAGAERLSVRGVGRRVRIIGDSSVATVSVEGPHVLRRNGTVLEVSSDGDIGPSFDGFSIIRPPHTLEDFRNLGLGKELLVRVNPEIALDVEVTGGTLRIIKVPKLGQVRLSAGSLKCRDVTEVEDALIQAGRANFEGTFSTGRSRIRVESGSTTVKLTPESDVTVRAESQLGKINWPDDQYVDELILGAGAARLDISVVMGFATIKLARDTEQEEIDEPAN